MNKYTVLLHRETGLGAPYQPMHMEDDSPRDAAIQAVCEATGQDYTGNETLAEVEGAAPDGTNIHVIAVFDGYVDMVAHRERTGQIA